ncbi:Tail-anchored protein insertion receptor WRB [Bienertia sinuspersici]
MDDEGSSLAAPTIFILMALLEFVPRYLEHQIRNGGTTSAEEIKIRAEIKQLLKEASSLTQPSTFAQAAKLRRTAAAKEKELTKYQEQQMLLRKSAYDPYMKYVTPALTCLLLVVWFWNYPVAAISKELVQPLGYMLSFKSGGSSEAKVMVGILPWLVLCYRVNKFLCRKVNM